MEKAVVDAVNVHAYIYHRVIKTEYYQIFFLSELYSLVLQSILGSVWGEKNHTMIVLENQKFLEEIPLQ